MITHQNVSIAGLLDALLIEDCHDHRIRFVLEGLAAEGHATLDQVTVPSWHQILKHGEPVDLYLILSGNASVAFARDVGTDSRVFSRSLNRIAKSVNPIEQLNEAADCHPLVLCKGELIGEFEYVQNQPCISHVIAGTFFKTPETRSRLQTILLKLPKNSAFASQVALHAITEKLGMLNQLLLPSIHKGLDRINNILAGCFAGLFPVYRSFHKSPDGLRLLVANKCKADGQDHATEYTCLARLDPFHEPIGIEVSTLYLTRCFGFASRESLTAEVNGYDLTVFSAWHAARALQETAVLDEHEQFAKSYWDNHRLGSESMFFFLKDTDVREFCKSYGVSFVQRLLKEPFSGASRSQASV